MGASFDMMLFLALIVLAALLIAEPLPRALAAVLSSAIVMLLAYAMWTPAPAGRCRLRIKTIPGKSRDWT